METQRMKPAEAGLLVAIAVVLVIGMLPAVRAITIGELSAFVWCMVLLMLGAPAMGLFLSRGDRR